MRYVSQISQVKYRLTWFTLGLQHIHPIVSSTSQDNWEKMLLFPIFSSRLKLLNALSSYITIKNFDIYPQLYQIQSIFKLKEWIELPWKQVSSYYHHCLLQLMSDKGKNTILIY